MTDQKFVQRPGGLDPIQPVSQGNVDNIENNFPEERFVVTANTLFAQDWNFMIRANYYGEHYDERGTLGVDKAKIDEVIFVDIELGWDITENFRVVAGSVNVFDEFIDEIGPPDANRLDVGLPYPRRSAANYEGGSWYLRGSYRW